MFFPSLKKARAGYINLADQAKTWLEIHNANPPEIKSQTVSEIIARRPVAALPPEAVRSHMTPNNPLIHPSVCAEFVDLVHKKHHLDFSYGGWLEDRSELWAGSYLDQGQGHIHLGLDINVSAGIEVATSFEAIVVMVNNDYPLDGGWGSYVVLWHLTKSVYLLFAHLDNVRCKPGNRLSIREVFAQVGHAPANGNWYPHVHVQVIESNLFKKLNGTPAWEDLDGYATPGQLTKVAKLHSDPLPYLGLFP